jgi:HEPN domain-containing protein
MPCEYYFANDTTKFIHFDSIKKYLSKIRALKFSEHGKQFIEIAKDLRNNIHIGKSIEIESENKDYNINFVEESLNTIKEVINALADFMNVQNVKNSSLCLAKRFRR